jgi:diphthamide biosynthesis protein 2
MELKYMFWLTRVTEGLIFYYSFISIIFSCCIDDVTAQHAKCDSLVHFGESCLSKTTERIPIFYVFGRFPIDIDLFDRCFEEFVAKTDLTDTTICLLCDSTFSHCQSMHFLLVFYEVIFRRADKPYT